MARDSCGSGEGKDWGKKPKASRPPLLLAVGRLNAEVGLSPLREIVEVGTHAILPS